MLVSSTNVIAADVPAKFPGTKIVTWKEVQKLKTQNALIVDVRVAAEYNEGHIKGAVSMPYRERSEKIIKFDSSKDEFAIGKLPLDKASDIVFYCNGPDCWKSYKATSWAMKAGYKNLHWYRDGFPDWKANGMPVE